MAGFGNPRYWLQVVYSEREDDWRPVTRSRKAARNQAAMALQEAGVDYVLVLDGKLAKGAVAEAVDILDEFQAYPVPGSKAFEPYRKNGRLI